MFLYRVVFLILLLSGVHLWAVPGTEEGISKLPEAFREEARAILKKYQELHELPSNERKLHLDLNDGVEISIFSKSGISNTKQCEADKPTKNSEACQSLGWPDNKSNITATGNLDFRVEEGTDGDKILKTYSEVNFSYDREGPKTGTGWVRQDVISFEPIVSSYSEIVMKKASEAQAWLGEKWEEFCTPVQNTSAVSPMVAPASKNNWLAIKAVTDKVEEQVAVENKKRLEVSEIAAKLSPLVGKCELEIVKKQVTRNGKVEVDAEVKVPQSFSGNLTYDQFVLPSIQKQSLPDNILKEDGTPLTKQDLITIDTMARTLYAEMAESVDLGSQYQQAVARVYRNREKEFIQGVRGSKLHINHPSEHDGNKSLLSKVLTSPVQVSAWNHYIIDFDALKAARQGEYNASRRMGFSVEESNRRAQTYIKPDMKTKRFYKRNDSGLLHTLCPPSNPKEIFYTGGLPPPIENAAWESSLKIAVESVLFSERFDERTVEVAGIVNYTSYRTSFLPGYTQVKPWIDGRQVNSPSLNLWKKPEEKAKPAASTPKAAAAHKSASSSKPQSEKKQRK